MNRRDFSKVLMGGSLAAFGYPLFGKDLLNEERSPWSVGFQGVSQDLAPIPMTVTGTIPPACQGTLYRNGPALYERAGQRYQHWFDPDGMIQAFRLNDQTVTHQGRFVRTEKFNREENAGQFLFDGAGSEIPGSIPMRNNDTINVANINIQPVNGELLALWEAGSPYRIELDTLETLGKVSLSDELSGVPFSAHPRVDEKGEIWNFGSVPFAGSPMLVLYHLDARGSLKKSKVQQLDFPGYQHDFVLTPNYMVMLNSSAVSGEGETFVDRFVWEDRRPSQLLVFDKQDFSLVKTIEVPPAFVFHFGNAWEEGGKLIFTASQYRDSRFMKEGMSRLAQQMMGPYHGDATLMRYEIDLGSAYAVIDDLEIDVEFPGFDRRYPFAQQPVLGVAGAKGSQDTLQSAIVQVNPVSGAVTRWDYGDNIIVEEPQFVPGSYQNPGKGFVVHSYLDFKTQRTGIAILRSDALADGPIARAEMDRCLPLGFHGCFIQS